MTRFTALAAALMIAATPVMADDTPAPPRNPELSQGAEKLSEGMKLLLKGLLVEGEKGWADLLTWLDDMSQYEAPERLPNGDIIIRRKVPDEPGGAEL
ncbi:MAG: AAA+ family ATPase [Maritimibacter sp.]